MINRKIYSLLIEKLDNNIVNHARTKLNATLQIARQFFGAKKVIAFDQKSITFSRAKFVLLNTEKKIRIPSAAIKFTFKIVVSSLFVCILIWQKPK